MKIIKYISLLFVIIISFLACEDDKDLTIIKEDSFVAPVLSGINSGDEFVFKKDTTKVDTLKKKWVKITWTDANYGEALATTYTVQIDRVDSNFMNPVEFVVGSETELEELTETVNAKMFDKGSYYPPLVQANVEIRVKAEVSEAVSTIYSDPIAFYITPFDAGKPKLYVTGTHQLTDWDFASAPTLYSLNEDEVYEGYIYFTDNSQFTLNKTPDEFWGAGASAGSIALGGSNLSIAAEGMYWMKADTLAEIVSSELRNWGVIGSATAGSWDTDTDMTYDFETGLLVATMDLTVGEIKFRANDAWSVNLGDFDADGSLEQDGTNIAVSSAGNYTVYLDLRNPGKLTYELIKN